MKKIVDTTDNKYVGLNVDETQPSFILEGWEFTPTKTQYLGGGYVVYSTTSYVILTKEINHGKD